MEPKSFITPEARSDRDLPHFVFQPRDRERPGRLRPAFLTAILFHLLAGLVLLSSKGEAWLRSGEAPVTLLQPRETPVVVRFYESRATPAPPPPDTAVFSDRPHRAQSQITPSAPDRSRQPAALGTSDEPREPGTPAPTPSPRPVLAAREAPTPVASIPGRATVSEAGEAGRPRIAALTAPEGREAAEERRPGALTTPRERSSEATSLVAPGARFSGQALDSAIRSSGFSNPQSSVERTGALDFDAKDFEWGPYARRVYEIVDRNWKSVIPLAASLPGVRGVARVRFRILRSGTVEDLELVQSTGRASLDQACLASIQLSNPLPPLPAEFPDDHVGVTFTYHYNI